MFVKLAEEFPWENMENEPVTAFQKAVAICTKYGVMSVNKLVLSVWRMKHTPILRLVAFPGDHGDQDVLPA